MFSLSRRTGTAARVKHQGTHPSRSPRPQLLRAELLEDRTTPSAVIDTIDFSPSRVGAVAANTATSRVYAAAEDVPAVRVIDSATNTVLVQIPTLGFHSDIDVDPVANRIYVSQQFARSVRVIDGATNAVLADLPVPGPYSSLGHMAVNPVTHRLYVSGADFSSLAVFDTDTHAFLHFAPLPVGGSGADLDINTALNRIYVTGRFSDNVAVLDGASESVVAVLPTGSAPVSVEVDSVSHWAFVVNNGSETVTVIDGLSNTVFGTVAVGSGPGAVDVNDDTGRVYVANNAAHTVSIIDGAGGTVLETVSMPVGAGTLGALTVVPGTNRIYVAGEPSSLFVVEDTGAIPLRSDLAAYYQFNTTSADDSGNGRDVNLFGGGGFAAGLVGEALDLHGNNNQFAQRPVDDSALDFGTGDFTLQIWVNYNSLIGEQTLIEKFEGGGGPGWSLTTFPNFIRFGVTAANGGGGILNAAVSIPTGVWHNVTVRRSGSTFDLFFDGARVATTIDTLPIEDTTFPLLIGRRNAADGRDFSVNGRIDEVAIWTRALSDSDLTALFNNGQGLELPTVNQAPTASAGGPYSVGEGGSVQLDASGSTDPDQPSATLTYEWDLDGDGFFGETGPDAARGDELGAAPT